MQIIGDAGSILVSSSTIALSLKNVFTINFNTTNKPITYEGRYGEIEVWPTYKVNFDVSSADSVLVVVGDKGSVSLTDDLPSRANASGSAHLLDYGLPYLVSIYKGSVNNGERFNSYTAILGIDPHNFTANSFALTVFEYTFQPVAASNFGLQVFGSNGALAYDSSLPPLKVTRFVNVKPGDPAYNKYSDGAIRITTDLFYAPEQSSRFGAAVMGNMLDLNIGISHLGRQDSRGIGGIYGNYVYFAPNGILQASKVVRTTGDSATAWNYDYQSRNIRKSVPFMIADVTNAS